MVVPAPGGVLNPLVLAAAELAGVDEIYRIGGAQAVAALAYGTATIAAVDKIVGPGNAYVAAAKRRVFGAVGIDMIAGPSEILVVADRANDPDWIAADLLAQAEHDAAAQAILVTDDAGFADRRRRGGRGAARGAAAAGRSPARAGARTARSSWLRDCGRGGAAGRPARAGASRAGGRRTRRRFAGRVSNAGAIFLGRYTPEAVGDYVGGPNHVLPTARSARFSSGLGVLDFMKRTSLLACDAASARAPSAPRRWRSRAPKASTPTRFRSPSGSTCRGLMAMTEPDRRIAKITLDERTVVRRNADIEHERAVAIFDLLEENSFAPAGDAAGPFHLHLGIEENRLVLDIRAADETPVDRVLVSLMPFRSIVKDYFLVCESYYDAIRTASPSRIEAIDMGRRALHDEGSELLRERLAERSRSISTPRGGSSRCSACCISGAERRWRGCPASVLFACTLQLHPLAHGGGAAEAFSRPAHLCRQRRRARGAEIDPFAVAVMDEIGIDISQPPAQDLRRPRGHLLRSRRLALARGAAPARSSSPAPWPARSNSGRCSTRPRSRAAAPRCLDAYRLVRDHLRRRAYSSVSR